MYKLVFSDLDGTLLNENHVVSDYSKEVIEALTNKGIHFFIATGRHHYDVFDKKKEIGLTKAYSISCNGARVHGPNGDLLIEHHVEDKVAQEIIDMEIDDKIMFSVFVENKIHIFNERDLEHYMTKMHMVEMHNVKEYVAKDVIKWFYYTEDRDELGHERLLKLEKDIKASWGDYVDTMFSLPHCLEIMPKGISKGYAIEEIARIEKVDLAEVIAFGDGFNDLEMLSVVGKGCIMENASEKLKEALPNNEIIGKNTEDAVAKYLKTLFL